MILEDDKELFKKLGLASSLDLVLQVPSSYHDYTLKSAPILDTNQLIDATILSVTKNVKYLKLRLKVHNFNKEINAIIFNPRYFHQKNFIVGKRYYLYGRIEYGFGLQIVQPKIVNQKIGEITPKYKQKAISDLIKKYINFENLSSFGLKKEIVDAILKIHFPDSNFFISYSKNNSFSGKYLKALKYTEIFNHILKLSKLKTSYPVLKKLTSSVKPFIDSLPFKLTNDQLKVIKEIESDFKSDVATKRVVMGDVGCGKTMVILASVVMCYPNRSILLAPTTVLAKQIYNEAKKFLPKEIRLGFVSNKTKEENLDKYDFIVGTHALLYRELPVAPLIMIDEQHRFGTKQRELINHLVRRGDKSPHFLQFSATPIPRTMAMIQSSYVDISVIKELPYKKDIDTKILYPKDFLFLVEHIKSEIEQNRQTIIVYPLVEESEVLDYQSIDEARGYWEKNFDKVFVTHGKDKEKEEVLEKFAKEGNILVATTLIEVGISLPKLSTIVIVAPERLGLATLHQLRGRVSRNGLKGYCYLFTKNEPTKRLKEFCKTLDGFKIAELDLKLRQSGDLLKGDRQSGKEFNFFDLSQDEEILEEVKGDWR
jgi:ATP-dependent DNA helicase RecG